jgi:DNA-binding NtrC family response regulator
MSKFRALIVDDEEELVTTLVERLGYRDIDAEYVLDGYEALLKLREKEFDVVMLDLKLPGMDGIEVLRKINKDHPEIPVLLITGHGSPEQGAGEKPPGAAHYLVKPMNLEDVIAKMEEVVKKK